MVSQTQHAHPLPFASAWNRNFPLYNHYHFHVSFRASNPFSKVRILTSKPERRRNWNNPIRCSTSSSTSVTTTPLPPDPNKVFFTTCYFFSKFTVFVFEYLEVLNLVTSIPLFSLLSICWLLWTLSVRYGMKWSCSASWNGTESLKIYLLAFFGKEEAPLHRFKQLQMHSIEIG